MRKTFLLALLLKLLCELATFIYFSGLVVRRHGLQDSMPTSTSQIRTIFVKRCTVWFLGCGIQNFLFVLIPCLHYDHLLKLAEVCCD